MSKLNASPDLATGSFWRYENANAQFPGTDGKASACMMRDVEADEQAAIAAIKELRRADAISFEAIGFMLGTCANRFRF